MEHVENDMDQQQCLGGAGFFRSHAPMMILLALMLVALPAYLSAMEVQFLDMEFLASLCGISGWGS
jgi:hypothetical protein